MLAMLAVNASAQTADDGGMPSDVRSDSLRQEKLELIRQLTDSTTTSLLPYSSSSEPLPPRYVPTMDMSIPVYKTPGQFNLWKGANLSVMGDQTSMPGLMGINSGALAFRQDYGRLHFTTLGIANKYWMPSMTVGVPTLLTQYGVDGTVSYDLSKILTLYAFGSYYTINPLVGPAVSPYAYTTQYGGYADIQLHKNFGVDTGVRRYLNPITGQWVTDPIVSPYIKFNNGQKLGVDVGHLLKDIIWGKQSHQYVPRGPVRMAPPPVQRRRR